MSSIRPLDSLLTACRCHPFSSIAFKCVTRCALLVPKISVSTTTECKNKSKWGVFVWRYICICDHHVCIQRRRLFFFFQPPVATQMTEALDQVSRALVPQHLLQLAPGEFG